MPFEFSVAYGEYLANVYLVPFLINFVLALLVFFIGRMVARMITRLVGKLAGRSNMDESLTKFLCDLLYGLLLMVVVIAALDRLGVKTTAAVAIIGAMGLAVGFALQGSLGNFASGVMIIGFKPYGVGDAVTVAGHTGKVEAVRVFQTELRTPDNRVILVPNGQITNGTIVNITSQDTRRIDMTFGIGYDDDIRKAKKMIEDVIAADDRILKEPAPQVAVAELADSSVNFVVRPWVKTEDYWAVNFDLLEKLKLTADEQGISIPYPQRDVHMHQAAS